MRLQRFWNNYGALDNHPPGEVGENTTQVHIPPHTPSYTLHTPHTQASVQSDEDQPVIKRHQRRITWTILWSRIVQFVESVWSLCLRISFILSIIAMMVYTHHTHHAHTLRHKVYMHTTCITLTHSGMECTLSILALTSVITMDMCDMANS